MRKGGGFLPKRPDRPSSYPIYPAQRRGIHEMIMGRRGGYQPVDAHPGDMSQVPGNLDHQDYRFYVGRRDRTERFAQCRVCLGVFDDASARRTHGKKTGCFKMLLAALQPSVRRTLCLVCGATTYNCVWGVPLCDQRKNCIVLWSFDIVQPRVLRDELIIANRKREAHEKILSLND